MDAANKYSFKTIALFLTIALLLAAPFAAQAQTAFSFPSGNSVSITGTSFGFIQVNADTGVITYKVTQVPAAGDPSLVFSQGGIQNAPSGSGGFQTGQQLAIAVGSIPGNV